MQCSNCGTVSSAGDRFCEECGTALVADSAMPNSTRGCEKCGAQPEAIDVDGYCSHCGFRNPTRESDRIEVTCSPNLAGVSDRGVKRQRNEDSLACATVDEKNAYILVVCDGVSSSQDSALAAKAAAEGASLALAAAVQTGNVQLGQAMKDAIASALRAVCAIPYTTDADADVPSTTIVA
ncbi:MAG TPA: zinc ribbon domain-containing protein, partial [Allocoleopsis sp.]